jgi:hypothetical protein
LKTTLATPVVSSAYGVNVDGKVLDRIFYFTDKINPVHTVLRTGGVTPLNLQFSCKWFCKLIQAPAVLSLMKGIQVLIGLKVE